MPWERWLTLLSDATRPLSVPVFGRTRVPDHWQVRNRRLTEHLCYFVLEGVVAVGGLGLRLEPWSLLWLPPGIEHAFSGLRHPITLYHLRFAMPSLPTATPRIQPLLMHRRRDLLPAFADLFDEYRARLPLREHAFRAKLVTTFCLVHRAEAGLVPGVGLDESRRTRIAAIVDQRLHHGLTPPMLAASVGLSLAHFTRLFTRTYGAAPRTWLMQERVRRAAMTLRESSDPIGHVALQHGFANVFIFSRQFRRVMGHSPRSWRHGSADR